MNDLVKSLMAWGGLGVAWTDFTIQEPSGNQQKTIRDLEAGWTAGWRIVIIRGNQQKLK